MSTFKQEEAVGIWRGTTSNAFVDYTELEIFKTGSSFKIRRNDKLQAVAPEGTLSWTSPHTFKAEVAHWVLPSPVLIRGEFHNLASGLCLSVQFANDGMTGLETILLQLKRNDKACEQYQVAQSIQHDTHNDGRAVSAEMPFPRGKAASLGLTTAGLDEALKAMTGFDPESPERKVDGLMILKDGLVVAEEYRWGLEAGDRHIVASVTKTIVALLAGIAWDNGLFTLEDVISESFEDATTTWADDEQIRVKHVLSLTSGTLAGDARRLLITDDLVGDVLSTTRIKKPGQKWHYNNDLPDLMGMFLEKRLEMKLEDFAEKELFEPMGIKNYFWTKRVEKGKDEKERDYVLCMGGMQMTLRDLGKIGQMMLDKGTWQNRRIISEAWIELCTQQYTIQGQHPYGFLTHLNTGGFYFPGFHDAYIVIGSGEQVICVIPAQHIVFVAVSSSYQSKSVTPVILELFSKHVLEVMNQRT